MDNGRSLSAGGRVVGRTCVALECDDGPPVRVRARTGALATSGAQEDVDRVAVPRAGGVAAKPVEIVGISCRDLTQGPSLVTAEVQSEAGTIGPKGSAWSAVSRIVAGRRWGSAPAIGLPDPALDRVADDGPRPVQVGHSRLGVLRERNPGIGMKLARQDAVRGLHDVRIRVGLHLEDPERIPTVDHRSR